MLTREYPPHVYGGAGVVVDQLTQALARRLAVEVRCFGERGPSTGPIEVRGYAPWGRVGPGNDRARYAAALETLSDRPGHGARPRRRRRGPRPHLVRGHGGSPDPDAPSHPARGDPAQPGAAPPVEGRPARHGLPRLDLGREDGRRGGRPGHRRVGQDARRHPATLPRRSGPRGGDPQRHRSRALSPHVPPRRAWTRLGVREPYVLFVGRITDQKGIFDLVEAAAALPARRAGGPVRLGSRHAGDRRAAAAGAWRGGRASAGSARCCRSRT